MPARHSANGRAVLAVATIAVLLAACSSDSVTGPPTTTDNVALMARFDSVLVGLSADQDARRNQLTSLITLLALGAPVQKITLSLDGAAAAYSAVAGFEVSDDIEGHPADSVYAVLAWRGDRADTLALVLIFQGLVDASLTTGDSAFTSGSDPASGAVTASAPNGECTSYLDHLPVDIDVPPGLSCQRQTATSSADVVVESDDEQPATHHLTLASQSVAGIRVEGQTNR